MGESSFMSRITLIAVQTKPYPNKKQRHSQRGLIRDGYMTWLCVTNRFVAGGYYEAVLWAYLCHQILVMTNSKNHQFKDLLFVRF